MGGTWRGNLARDKPQGHEYNSHHPNVLFVKSDNTFAPWKGQIGKIMKLYSAEKWHCGGVKIIKNMRGGQGIWIKRGNCHFPCLIVNGPTSGYSVYMKRHCPTGFQKGTFFSKARNKRSRRFNNGMVSTNLGCVYSGGI